MKPYPTIPGGVRRGAPVHIFDKLDGSNVRVEWTRKREFHKFGKRSGLLDGSWDMTPHLCEAPGLITAKYEEDLSNACRANRWDKATFFFEFSGPSSFAGWHVDEPHDVVLIDASVHRKGFLEPKDYVRLFGHLDMAKLLHVGNFTQDIADQVAAGTFQGMTFEGVVAKGAWDKKMGCPLMFKWKNLAWFAKLRDRCNGDEALFESLM